MASRSTSNPAPLYQHQHNCKLLLTSASYSKSILDEQRQKYSDAENEIIKEAYDKNEGDVKLNDGRVIKEKDSIQYMSQDRKDTHIREERFATPIPIFIPNSNQKVEKTSMLFYMRHCSNITDVYRCSDNLNWKKPVFDIIEEAVQGIIKEGIILGEEERARSLANQLENVKHYANNLLPYEVIPSEIGDILISLYTKESFWYKLINRIVRDIKKINAEQVTTIGSFCYLLHTYLKWNDETSNCSVVYRGINLTDEERGNFMKSDICFSSFTSTSKSREVAEFYDSNTLLIIDLDPKDLNNPYLQAIRCGSDIATISEFPTEEEFLIWPGSIFDFFKYEYDEPKNKHILYLKQSWRDPR